MLRLFSFVDGPWAKQCVDIPKYHISCRIFSYLDVVSLCRCAQVSKAWNVLALDGSNWQRIDLFDFQTDVEVWRQTNYMDVMAVTYLIYFAVEWSFKVKVMLMNVLLSSGSSHWKHFTTLWRVSAQAESPWLPVHSWWLDEDVCPEM